MLKTEVMKRPATPGHFAICRNLTDGDWAAAALLQRIVGLWLYRDGKGVNFLKRLGTDWIAMSRSDWAVSAGLSEAEMKDRALPRLKKTCASFVTVRTMRLSPDEPNLLWVSLDREQMNKAVTPWDMHEAKLNGQGIFAKPDNYPYKVGE
jgi:hypothetical protein